MRHLFQQMISAMPLWMRDFLTRATSGQLLPLLVTIRIGGLILAGLAMWGFAEIADQVLEQESHSMDTAILLLLKSWHTPFLERVMLSFTFVGEPSSLLVVSVLIGIWLLIERRYKEATTIVIAAAGSGALNYWLKELFARSRPQLWERVVDVQHYSFPSGHAMVSMVVYGIIGYLLSTHFPRWSGLIISSTLLLVVGIGFSRLYFGVHWPTDVIAGFAAGLVWLIACIFSLEIWHEFRDEQSRLKDKSLLPSSPVETLM